jgi:hypothetical protein
MRVPKIRQAIILALILFAFGIQQHATAQVNTAAIHGTVTDSSGAVLPNAEVTILNTSTNIASTAKTDSKGYFATTQLQTGGPYTVTIVAAGFTKSETTGINLNVNDDRAVDARLQIGSSSQTVQVEANSVQVESTETQLKTDISASEIEQLPLLGRDASQLEKTAPGVMESSDRFGSFSANGAQTTQSSYLLDGADVNDVALQDNGLIVNPDALGELAVVTSTLNPEYSRNSGAIINETLKTGTNGFHGNAFEFYRDTFLNNGNYFSLPGQRPQFHQNVFGGTLGGPVLKDKLFFFLAYQGIRNRTGGTQQTPVFGPDTLAGDFSGDVNQSSGGLNGAAGLSSKPIPFAIAGCAAGTAWNACPAIMNGQIPTSSFNPLALTLANKYVPASNTQTVNPNTGAITYLYNFSTAQNLGADQGVIRIDYHPTQNDALWSSAIFDSAPNTAELPFNGATLPGFAETNSAHVKVFNADYTHTFSASAINELRAGYFRFNFSDVNPQTPTLPSSVGFNINPQSPSAGLPAMGLLGYFTLGFSSAGPQPRKDSNLLGSDIFTKVAGNHTLKFGFTFEQFGVDNPYFSNNNGNFGYDGGGLYSSGDPAIDFLLGIPDSYVQASGSQIDAISHEYYAFAQDSWKVNSDLTLNYGISWDVETPWANHQFAGEGITCWQNSSATSKIYPNGAPGLLYPGDPGCSTYGSGYVRYHDFGPRFGFAWSPSSGPSAILGTQGSHQFAVRGGFGMYFNRDQEEEALQNLSSPPYFFQSLGVADLSSSYSPAFANPFADVTGAAAEPNPFPYQVPAPGSQLNWQNYSNMDISNVSKNYLPSYAYNFNLNIQRELPGRMVAQIGYVGSIGQKLPRVSEGDPITAAGHAACLADTTGCAQNGEFLHALYPQYAAQPALSPNGTPWYLSVGNQLSNGSSSYHSLQMSLSKQTSHGLYFTLAYTYSHALDNGSGYESASNTSSPNGVGGSNGRPVNFIPGFENRNYGSSDYDARQRFVAVYNYEIPLLQSMKNNYVVKEALSGWHLSGDTALQTGFPVTISSTGVYNSLWCDRYTYYVCPDVPNVSTSKIQLMNPRNASHTYFNTSPFSQEPLGTFGNSGRNFFHGPGFNYTNLELYKDFPVGSDSRRYVELRLESYNVFNHPNFAQPDGNFNDSTFGQTLSVIQPSGFGGQATDPQPGRATQLGAKFYF